MLIEPRNAVANCSIGVLPIFYLLDQSQHQVIDTLINELHGGLRASASIAERRRSAVLRTTNLS